jgi:hypothetical protein
MTSLRVSGRQSLLKRHTSLTRAHHGVILLPMMIPRPSQQRLLNIAASPVYRYQVFSSMVIAGSVVHGCRRVSRSLGEKIREGATLVATPVPLDPAAHNKPRVMHLLLKEGRARVELPTKEGRLLFFDRMQVREGSCGPSLLFCQSCFAHPFPFCSA